MCNDPLWAITAYFNPAKYSRRLHNYRLFRQHLRVPLVAVELANDKAFELQSHDAEILVQLRSSSILWQKERLLNIALQYVPRTVPCIAWLDCDVILEPSSWSDEAVGVLESLPILQVFSRLYDLGRDVLPSELSAHPDTPTSHSVAYKVATKSSSIEDFRPTTAERRGLGFGWAARRDLLDRHGLYDAFILGSGDRAIGCAAYGRFEDAIYQVRLTESQTTHYLAWARPFFEEAQGRVGFVNAVIYHLWHGHPKDRRYQERHVDFSRLGFNPFNDISIDDQGCWKLVEGKEQLQEYIKRYFDGRKEDGD